MNQLVTEAMKNIDNEFHSKSQALKTENNCAVLCKVMKTGLIDRLHRRWHLEAMEILPMIVDKKSIFLKGIWKFIAMLVEDYHCLSFTTVAKIVHTAKGYTKNW